MTAVNSIIFDVLFICIKSLFYLYQKDIQIMNWFGFSIL